MTPRFMMTGYAGTDAESVNRELPSRTGRSLGFVTDLHRDPTLGLDHLATAYHRHADAPDLPVAHDYGLVADVDARVGTGDTDGEEIALQLEIHHLDDRYAVLSEYLRAVEGQGHHPALGSCHTQLGLLPLIVLADEFPIREFPDGVRVALHEQSAASLPSWNSTMLRKAAFLSIM